MRLEGLLTEQRYGEGTTAAGLDVLGLWVLFDLRRLLLAADGEQEEGGSDYRYQCQEPSSESHVTPPEDHTVANHGDHNPCRGRQQPPPRPRPTITVTIVEQ